jgi:hypothetical protein
MRLQSTSIVYYLFLISISFLVDVLIEFCSLFEDTRRIVHYLIALQIPICCGERKMSGKVI